MSSMQPLFSEVGSVAALSAEPDESGASPRRSSWMPVGWAAEVEGGSPAGVAGREPRSGFGGVARSGRLRSRADRSKDLAASASPLHMATASPSRSLQFFTC